MKDQVLEPESLIIGTPSDRDVTEVISRPVEATPPSWWLISIFGSTTFVLIFVASLGYLFWEGVGVWGLNSPVFWAFDIINMVFWVGIAHTGTAVTSFFTLARQPWKNSINRIAEAMTIFSVMCAGLFPVIHEGRTWMLHYFMPYPNQMWMWPNFKSPIFADIFALSAYLYVSAIFWYIGMIPDIASIRDRAKNKISFYIYGVLALGWRGSATHWNHYEKAYLLLAGIGTPLVLSVCGIVSLTFGPSVIPGWHATIFPLYFLVGALSAGFAMLSLLVVWVRTSFGFQNLITDRHLDLINRFTLACLLGVSYVYGIEIFTAWISGNIFESFTIITNRLTGPYNFIYFLMLFCNVFLPQLFWFKAFRRSQKAILIIAGFVTIGMWCERFVIVTMSVHRDYLPGSWGMYFPTPVEIATFLGSVGLFLTMFLIFIKYLPTISMAEVKTILPKRHSHH